MDYIGLPQSWSKLLDFDRFGLATSFGPLASAGHIEVPTGRKSWWAQMTGPTLEGWRPKSLADADGCCRSVMSKFDSSIDTMGSLLVPDISEILRHAAQAIRYEKAGGQKCVVKLLEDFETERTLRGKLGPALKTGTSGFRRHRRRHKTALVQ